MASKLLQMHNLKCRSKAADDNPHNCTSRKAARLHQSRAIMSGSGQREQRRKGRDNWIRVAYTVGIAAVQLRLVRVLQCVPFIAEFVFLIGGSCIIPLLDCFADLLAGQPRVPREAAARETRPRGRARAGGRAGGLQKRAGTVATTASGARWPIHGRAGRLARCAAFSNVVAGARPTASHTRACEAC